MFGKIINFFKVKKIKQDRGDQVVIIDGRFESGEDFGTEQERYNIITLEEVLTEIIELSGIRGEYDGHDFGEGTFTLYVYGESADTVFDCIKNSLIESGLNNLQITLQYGPPSANTVSKRLSLGE